METTYTVLQRGDDIIVARLETKRRDQFNCIGGFCLNRTKSNLAISPRSIRFNQKINQEDDETITIVPNDREYLFIDSLANTIINDLGYPSQEVYINLNHGLFHFCEELFANIEKHLDSLSTA